MPAQTRKNPKAAEAAAAEALNEGDVSVEFRGETFVVKRETRQSFRLAMAIASNSQAQMIYELITPADRPRFIALGKPGEAFSDVATEWFAALNKASGQGNS